MEKLKSLIINTKNQPNKKKIENLVFFIIITIIVIIAINSIWLGDKNKPIEESQRSYGKELAKEDNIETGKTLEERLEQILSKIDGVGNVKVLITYSESSETIAMYNENNKDSVIEETDSNGGKRVTKQNDTSKEVIYDEEAGIKSPVTQKVITPKVEGAVVIAVGADNAVIKNNIVQAVEALTGLATHKIQVFEMKKS